MTRYYQKTTGFYPAVFVSLLLSKADVKVKRHKIFCFLRKKCLKYDCFKKKC